MLITPMQPHNSFSNIVTDRRPSQAPNNTATPESKILSSARKISKLSSGVNQTATRKKFLLDLKLQKTMHRNTSQKLQSIAEHKGDLVQRKQMLSEILKEYEQISKDKNVLTAEIRNMKKYLSDIRLKLDQSLLILNRNTTLFSMKKSLTNSMLLDSNRLNHKRTRKPKKSIKNKTPQVITYSSLKLKP